MTLLGGASPRILGLSACRRASQSWLLENMIALNVYAEKGPRSTWDRTPAQHTYRSKADWDRYIAIVEGHRGLQRPYIRFGAPWPISANIPADCVRVGRDGCIHYAGLEEPQPAMVTGAV
jgi:hypothetical protein